MDPNHTHCIYLTTRYLSAYLNRAELEISPKALKSLIKRGNTSKSFIHPFCSVDKFSRNEWADQIENCACHTYVKHASDIIFYHSFGFYLRLAKCLNLHNLNELNSSEPRPRHCVSGNSIRNSACHRAVEQTSIERVRWGQVTSTDPGSKRTRSRAVWRRH